MVSNPEIINTQQYRFYPGGKEVTPSRITQEQRKAQIWPTLLNIGFLTSPQS
jgi:hypothetical protein